MLRVVHATVALSCVSNVLATLTLQNVLTQGVEIAMRAVRKVTDGQGRIFGVY